MSGGESLRENGLEKGNNPAIICTYIMEECLLPEYTDWR